MNKPPALKTIDGGLRHLRRRWRNPSEKFSREEYLREVDRLLDLRLFMSLVEEAQ